MYSDTTYPCIFKKFQEFKLGNYGLIFNLHVQLISVDTLNIYRADEAIICSNLQEQFG